MEHDALKVNGLGFTYSFVSRKIKDCISVKTAFSIVFIFRERMLALWNRLDL